MHTTLVKKPEESTKNWKKTRPAALAGLYTVDRELRGTISGERGGF